MDPNACLEAIRNACRALNPLIDAGDDTGPNALPEPAADLARAVEDLDSWLCQGGFTPAAWTGAAR